MTGTFSINNLPPMFVSPVQTSLTTSPDGTRVLQASAEIHDIGVRDDLLLTGDFEGTVIAGDPLRCSDEIVFPTACSVNRTVSLTETVSAASSIDPHRALFTATDDDTGESVYRTDRFFTAVNQNDSNADDRADFLETSISYQDPEVTEYPIGDFITAVMDNDLGEFLLEYDPTMVLLWTDATKSSLFAPYWGMGYGGWHSGVPAIPYEGQSEVFVELIAPGSTQITLGFIFDYHVYGYALTTYGGHVVVSGSGIDLDIDSDNDNGVGYPEGDAWEEELEDHSYAIGKILCESTPDPDSGNCDPRHPGYAPARIRLAAGLDNGAARVRLDLQNTNTSGNVLLSLVSPLELTAENRKSIADGGVLIEPGVQYDLDELGYNSGNGSILVVVIGDTFTNVNATKRAIELTGKPVDRILATLIPQGGASSTAPLQDAIRYMNVVGDTFYEHLDRRDQSGLLPRHGLNGEMLRSSLASELVYQQIGSEAFALRELNESDIEELGFSDAIATRITHSQGDGLKVILYREYVTGGYVMAFAGTEFPLPDEAGGPATDMIENLKQAIGWLDGQYKDVMKLAYDLTREDQMRQIFARNSFMFVGHSLGGGLASAAYLATGYKADTFNAAGIDKDILYVGLPNPLVTRSERYHGSIGRFNNPIGVDAYYLEYDVLSWAQDHPGDLPIALRPFLHRAIGIRYMMEGPYDIDESDLVGLNVFDATTIYHWDCR